MSVINKAEVPEVKRSQRMEAVAGLKVRRVVLSWVVKVSNVGFQDQAMDEDSDS